MVGPTIEDKGPTSGIKYPMIQHHKINTHYGWRVHLCDHHLMQYWCRVRTNSQTQLNYPMGFHCSAMRSCPISPTSVTSCPRWILSNSDGWIMLMVLPLKIRVPRVASSIQWFNIIKSIPIMAGASISATSTSYNTGVGSVPTLKLSCTTPWVSTVLPSSTHSCPMSPTSVTSCPRWNLSNTDRWITLMVEPESTSAMIGIPLASILRYKTSLTISIQNYLLFKWPSYTISCRIWGPRCSWIYWVRYSTQLQPAVGLHQ